MSYSESEYDTYSDDSFNSEESSVKEKEEKYSTKGITLDNPSNYRRTSIKKSQQEKTEDTSEYTDDTSDDDYSIGSISDDRDDIDDKKLSDREKLQILEEQLANSKDQSPKHKGRYTESEDESDYDDSEFDTESDDESDNAKVKEANKKNTKQKTLFEDEEEDSYDIDTNSEFEEETESEEEDDYTAFLMKQLQQQQEHGKINMEDNYVKDVVNEEDKTVYAGNSTNEKQNQNIDIEAKVEEVSTSKTLLESRTGSRHSLQSSETEKDDEKDLHATSAESTKSKNSNTKPTEDVLKSKNMLSNDQYKSNSDYSNGVNGAEEQKLESSQCENMQGNGNSNSEPELNLSEAERRDDKSDKTSMKGFDVDSSSCGNEKGDKSNLNSNRRRSGKHIDPGTDGDHGESISLDSFPSLLQDNITGQRASTDSGQSKSKDFKAESASTVSSHGGFDEENADQTAVGLSQMDLKSDLQSLNKDKMSESVWDLNVKGDSESVTPGNDESRDAKSRGPSKESLPNVNENESPSSVTDTTKPLNNAVENSEEILETKTETVDKEDDTQHEKKEESKEDSPQQNSNERTDANENDRGKDSAISRRNSTTSSQIDDKVIETVSKENSVDYLSRRVSREMDFLESDTDFRKDDRGAQEKPDESKPNANDPDTGQSLPEKGQGSSKVKSNPDLKNDDKSQEVDENKPTKVAPSRWKKAAKVAVLKESNPDKNYFQTPPNDTEDKRNNVNIKTEDSEKNNRAENAQNHDEMKDKEGDADGMHAENEADKKKTKKIVPSRWKNAAKNAVSKHDERKDDQMAENDADDKPSNVDGKVEDADKDKTAECVQDSDEPKGKDGDNDRNYVKNRQDEKNTKGETSHQADNHTGDGNKTPDRNNKEAGNFPNDNAKENGEDTDINASKNSFESIEKEIKEDTSSSTNTLEKSSTPVKEVDEITTESESNNKPQYNSADVDSVKRQQDPSSSKEDSSTSPKSIEDGNSAEQTDEPNNETMSNKHCSHDNIIEHSEKEGSQSTTSVSSNKSAQHKPVTLQSPQPEHRSTGQAENSDKGENTEGNGKMLKDPHQSSQSPLDDSQPSSSPNHQEHRSEHTVKGKLSRSTSRVSLKSTTSRKSTKSKSSATKRNSVTKSRGSLRTTCSKSSMKESQSENKEKKEKETNQTNETKSEKSDTFRKENDRDSTFATVEEKERENKEKVSKSRTSLQSKSGSKDNSMESSPDESTESSVENNNDKKAEDPSQDDLKVLSNKTSLEEDEKSVDHNEDNTQIKTVQPKEQSDDHANAKDGKAMKETCDKDKTKEVTSDGVSQENNNSKLKPTEDDLATSETSSVSEKKNSSDEHHTRDKTMETKEGKSPIQADSKPHTAEQKSGTMESQVSLSSQKRGETKDDSENSEVTENKDCKHSKEKDAEFGNEKDSDPSENLVNTSKEKENEHEEKVVPEIRIESTKSKRKSVSSAKEESKEGKTEHNIEKAKVTKPDMEKKEQSENLAKEDEKMNDRKENDSRTVGKEEESKDMINDTKPGDKIKENTEQIKTEDEKDGEPIVASKTLLEIRKPTDDDDVQSIKSVKPQSKSTKKKRKKSKTDSLQIYGSTASLRSIYDDLEPKKSPMGAMTMYDDDNDDEEFGDDLIVEAKLEDKPVKEKAKVKPKKSVGKENTVNESERNKNKSSSTPMITYKPPVASKRHSEKGKKAKKEIVKEKDEDRTIKEKVESQNQTPKKPVAVKSEKKDIKLDKEDAEADKRETKPNNIDAESDKKDTKPERKDTKAKSKDQQKDTCESNEEEMEPEPGKKTDNKSERKPKLRPLKLKSWEANKYSDNADKDQNKKNFQSLIAKKRRRSAPVAGNVTEQSTTKDRRSQTAQRPRSPKSPSTTYIPGEKYDVIVN